MILCVCISWCILLLWFLVVLLIWWVRVWLNWVKLWCLLWMRSISFFYSNFNSLSFKWLILWRRIDKYCCILLFFWLWWRILRISICVSFMLLILWKSLCWRVLFNITFSSKKSKRCIVWIFFLVNFKLINLLFFVIVLFV